MTAPLIDQVTELLQRTGAAHGEYETRVLGGVYDEAWADWYAETALGFGLNSLLGANFEVEELSKRLTDLNEDLKQAQTGEAWAQYTARRLIEG